MNLNLHFTELMYTRLMNFFEQGPIMIKNHVFT